MDHRRLQTIGEQLRSLGHDRRECVEAIQADVTQGSMTNARQLYQRLDHITEQCMDLLQQQRDLVANELRASSLR